MTEKKPYVFHSGFAKDLNAFIEYKESLGYKSISYLLLNNFDQFCAKKYPSLNTLTSEVVTEWCTISDKGIINRCCQIREFGKYLLTIGKPTYIYPAQNIPSRHTGLPYIMSPNELEKFFKVTDQFTSPDKSDINEYTAPVVFRLMLGCGFRPREVVHLRRLDFDFRHRTIYIADSKRHRDRRVAVSNDLSDLCERYDRIANGLFPARSDFFPDRNGDALSYSSLAYIFRKCWHLSGNDSGKGQPSLYSFRFTFATETLMRWIEEGKDIESMIPYLSAYMGHVRFRDTYYYIKLLPDRISKMEFMNVNGIIPEVKAYE